MNDQNLQELLEKLHNELERVDVTDEAGRERLRYLQADIRALRERAEEQTDTDESMLERFQESIEHFQETHPDLTMTISRISTILSNAGI
jgi:hypothetical protein